MLPNSKISSIPSRIGGFYQTAQLSTQPAPFEGHTFGNIDVRDSATVQLGDNYIDHYNVYNNYADNGGHDEVISKLEAQNVAMSDVQKKLAPLAQASQRTLNKVTLLHEANQVQHDVLLDIQSSVRKIPSLTRSDSIQFIDALDRHYELPFTHFAHWQVCSKFHTPQFHVSDASVRSLRAFSRAISIWRIRQVPTKSILEGFCLRETAILEPHSQAIIGNPCSIQVARLRCRYSLKHSP